MCQLEVKYFRNTTNLVKPVDFLRVQIQSLYVCVCIIPTQIIIQVILMVNIIVLISFPILASVYEVTMEPSAASKSVHLLSKVRSKQVWQLNGQVTFSFYRMVGEIIKSVRAVQFPQCEQNPLNKQNQHWIDSIAGDTSAVVQTLLLI